MGGLIGDLWDGLRNNIAPITMLALGNPLGALYMGYKEHEQRKQLREADRKARQEAADARKKARSLAAMRGISGSTTEQGYIKNIDDKLNDITSQLSNARNNMWKRDLVDIGFNALIDPSIFSNARNFGGIWRDIRSKGINYFTKAPQIKYRNKMNKGYSYWQYPYF